VRHLSSLVVTTLVASLVACVAPTDPVTGDDAPVGEDDEPSTPEDETPLLPPTDDPIELVPGCTAKSTVAGFTTWFFFTRPDKPCTPTAEPGLDYHAIAELTRLIDSVPAGGRIDGHIFSITVDTVGKSLLDAQTRGVDVNISTDGQMATSTDAVKGLYLDKLDGIVYCASATSNSCISTADNAISHTKLFVFSHATAPDQAESDNVVWFGSANQTANSGMRLYNNTVTIYGDTPLYASMRDYLDDLRNRKRAADYYDPATGRGHLLTASADVYISPEAQTDLVVNRLDDLTPDSTCRVRVMQASVRDTPIVYVNRLVTLKKGGCQVSVVASTVEPDALAALKAAKIPVRHMLIHDKVFVVYGRYGAGYQYRVYTGSHNLSGGSAHRYDEIFVKLAPELEAAHPVYDEYVTHFDDAYSVGTAL
jgi:phosphatidylserine/phosphatidylglycerophosphate/cardiolipin synthase-like enzyme